MNGAAVSTRHVDADPPARHKPAPAAAQAGLVLADVAPAPKLRKVSAPASAGPSAETVKDAPAPRRPPHATEEHSAVRGDLLLYLLLAVLLVAAWQLSQLPRFKSSDDTSYWIGVAGGSMMLVLFTYPLRKHVRFLQNLGKIKAWFWFHLFLGIAGPWLILVHSTFHIGSVNAGVALISMLIVVGSGVVGRFIYVRVHRGLHGEETSLADLRRRAGMVESKARSRLNSLPTVEARLREFERREIEAEPTWWTHLRQVGLLPLQQQVAYIACVRDLRQCLRAFAAKGHWSDEDLQRRERKAARVVRRYLDAVVRVAQYKAYERVFALWHVAHLPFVYLMVISAVVHVIAVHAY